MNSVPAIAIIVTPYGEVGISKATAGAMNRSYPGWDERYLQTKTAIEGREELTRCATFVARLNWALGANITADKFEI